MKNVVVDMHNMLFADAIARTLTEFNSDTQVYVSEDPGKTEELCLGASSNVLIMDVTSYMPWRIEERLSLRGNIKKELPDCKIVFVVDENSESELADRVRMAMKEKLIDNFIYGSVSSAYLSAVIDTL